MYREFVLMLVGAFVLGMIGFTLITFTKAKAAHNEQLSEDCQPIKYSEWYFMTPYPPGKNPNGHDTYGQYNSGRSDSSAGETTTRDTAGRSVCPDDLPARSDRIDSAHKNETEGESQ